MPNTRKCFFFFFKYVLENDFFVRTKHTHTQKKKRKKKGGFPTKFQGRYQIQKNEQVF